MVLSAWVKTEQGVFLHGIDTRHGAFCMDRGGRGKAFLHGIETEGIFLHAIGTG